MQTVLIVIHLVIVLSLVGVVLLQRSEGGLGLGGGGSGVSGFMTGRGQANALTRATAILAGLFFATSILLSILANHNRAPSSILNVPVNQSGQPAPPAPSGEGILNDLKRFENTPETPQVPASPSVPVTPQVPQSR